MTPNSAITLPALANDQNWTTDDRLSSALKEWSVVTRALARGDQTALLRKGGLVEQTGEFVVEQRRFLLFPSQFHPAPELLQPPFRPWLNEPLAETSTPNTIRLAAWAEATASFLVPSAETGRELAQFTIYEPDYAVERFTMQKHRPLYLVAVRAYRLPTPIVLPMRPEYRGCTSWVDLAESVDLVGSTPALTDAAYTATVAEIAARI